MPSRWTVFLGGGGYFVLSGQFEPTTNLLPVIANQPQSWVAGPGDDVSFSVTAQTNATQVGYQWYQNGLPLNGQTAAQLTLTNVGIGQVGTYSARVTDVVTGRYADSDKAVLELSSDPAQGVLLQDKLDALSRMGPLPPPCGSQIRPKDLVTGGGDFGTFSYSVSAGTVGLHVGNNTQATTDLGEGNPGGLIGHHSLWMYFTTTNAGVLEVDTRGSAIDNLFALYDYGNGVNWGNLEGHLLGAATNGASASVINSVWVTNGPGVGRFLLLADALYQERGPLAINWAFGSLPQTTNAAGGVPAPQRLEAGTNFILRLSDAAVTNALPPPTYWWYRDGQLLAQTKVPFYQLPAATIDTSGTYSVVASNALFVITNVLERLLTRVPLQLEPRGEWLSGGIFRLGISGTEGDSVALQATTNLVNWQVLTNLNLDGYEQRFDDVNATSFERRFYRVR